MPLCQAAANETSKTKISMVRFGNVLGSSGSVIPIFKEQISKGGPITLTHKDITRYFMTITEAAQLVIQAGAMGTGGDVFVLDMGKPVKIVELAEQLITLSGKEPYKDIDIQFSGVRPGEKLFEELFYASESMQQTEKQKVFESSCREYPLITVISALTQLEHAYKNRDQDAALRCLMALVPEYTSQVNDVCQPACEGIA